MQNNVKKKKKNVILRRWEASPPMHRLAQIKTDTTL